MKNIVKIVSNVLVSAVVAVTSVASMFNRPEIPEATAYSNTQRFVDTARSYSNIGPAPNIVTNFWGINGPWCAMYVYFIAAQCGLADTHIPKYSYCDNQYGIYGYKNYYEDLGRFQYSKDGFFPEVGDLIIFDTDDIKDQKGDHIGIVIETNKATGFIKTLEGNGKNGGTYEGNYPYYDSSILGYCKTQLDGASSGEIAPAPPVSSEPVAPTQPSFSTSQTKWELTSPDGGWLRSEPNGTKLGIISTGTILNSDPSKNQNEWIYVKSAFTLTGTVFDGYVHYTNLTPYNNQSTTTTTAATTTTTTTTTSTTATTTTTAESSTTTTTVTTKPSSEETAPQEPQSPANIPSHFVSSLIGANARTSADFDENNIAKIIDTDTYLIVNYIKNEFANCTIPDTGETYFIHTSTISELPVSDDDYTECARTNYYVSSPIGCNFRNKADYSGEILCILDTWQNISVLSSPNELGFVYIEFTYSDGVVHNGYVHIDHITAY